VTRKADRQCLDREQGALISAYSARGTVRPTTLAMPS
jgi:hypothetical protein